MDKKMSDDEVIAYSTEKNKTDLYVSAGKGVLGAVPLVGPALSEIITQLVPNQRHDRIENYLIEIEKRLSILEQNRVLKLFQDDNKVALFEDGAIYSARTKNREQIKNISTLVSDGLLGSEKTAIENSRILRLLDQVDSDQIIILTSKTSKYAFDHDFKQKNEEVLFRSPVHMQSTREEMDASVQYELSITQLVALGLLIKKAKSFKKGETPEFDKKTGLPITTGTEITALGRLLLRKLKILEEDET